NEDVFTCNSATTGTATSCASLSKYFDGSDNGITNNLDAIHISAGTGADPGGNQAPMVLDPEAGGTVTAYETTASGHQVLALDPNGDSPLSYTLCRGPSGGPCGALPAGISINGNGLISFVGPALADEDTYHLIVTDPFGATGEREFTLDVVSPNAPVANDDYFDVTVVGQWVLPYTETAEGLSLLQLNDVYPDEALHGVVFRQIVTTPGLDQLQPPGSGFISIDTQTLNPADPELPILSTLVFTPTPEFVGEATFEYSLTNNSGTNMATVTLNRGIAMTDARYEPTTGMYHFEGFGEPGEFLLFSLDPALPGSNVTLDGPVLVAGDGTWSLDTVGPVPMEGDLIDVVGSIVPHAINDAPLLSTTSAGSSPLSSAYVQCPGDIDGDAEIDVADPDPTRQVVCKHIGAGDGFTRLADGRELYGFSYSDLTGVPENLAIDKGILNAQFPAPTMEFKQNDEVYLTMTNVAMLIRPDLFDAHTVHFHGFPNAATVFDGVPDNSISVNGGFSQTYYYNVVQPGTYIYHCHFEATEHMQMGMMGNLYVDPVQNTLPPSTPLGSHSHSSGDRYVYNDGDASTLYDVVVPIQIMGFDSAFHDASFFVQPLPFGTMRDDYPLLNGRGYPDTKDPSALPVKVGGEKATSGVTSKDESSNKEHTLITATVGQTILLRINNVSVTEIYTIGTTGLPMQIVGQGAHILRGPGGDDLYYEAASVTVGGGEAVDVLIDTAGVPAGTYVLYGTNLNELSNGTEDFGGMMTEIVIH
ncbi:MAG: multicopper oxidase domain-containing protein, partial [Gammaproteobacteria bacterium]|nr:multicopper oxidase domain-containing protein [Gammaproteobacteria bacterium]